MCIFNIVTWYVFKWWTRVGSINRIWNWIWGSKFQALRSGSKIIPGCKFWVDIGKEIGIEICWGPSHFLAVECCGSISHGSSFSGSEHGNHKSKIIPCKIWLFPYVLWWHSEFAMNMHGYFLPNCCFKSHETEWQYSTLKLIQVHFLINRLPHRRVEWLQNDWKLYKSHPISFDIVTHSASADRGRFARLLCWMKPIAL